ncbi:MAG: hypothetical protein R2695_04620 [Acidimicrobiales bacterium]
MMKRFRIRVRDGGRVLRVVWIGGQAFLGAVALTNWSGSGQRVGRGFWGLIVTFLAVSWIVAEIRESAWGAGRRGRWLFIGCLGLVLVAVWLTALPGWIAVALLVVGLAVGQLAVVTGSHDILRRGAFFISPRFRLILGTVALVPLTAILTQISGPWGLGVGVGALVLMLLTVSRASGTRSSSSACSRCSGRSPHRPIPPTSSPSRATTAPTCSSCSATPTSPARGPSSTTTGRTGPTATRAAGPPPLGPCCWRPSRTARSPTRCSSSPVPGRRPASCGGSTRAVGDDWESWRDEGEGQLAQLRHELAKLGDRSVRFVLVSIGGNDSGFSKIATTCLAPGDCTEIARQWVDLLTVRRPFDRLPDGHHGIDDASTLEAHRIDAHPGDELTSTLQEEIERAYTEIRRPSAPTCPSSPCRTPIPSPTRAAGPRCCRRSSTNSSTRSSTTSTRRSGAPPALKTSTTWTRSSRPSTGTDSAIRPAGTRASTSSGRSPSTDPSRTASTRPGGCTAACTRTRTATNRCGPPRSTGSPPIPTSMSCPPRPTTALRAPALVRATPPDTCPDRDNDQEVAAAPARFVCNPSAWALDQVLRHGRAAMWWVLTIFIGAWLLALEAIRRIESHGVGLSRPVPGVSYRPSWAEHLVLRVLDSPPLRWIHGGVDPRTG